MLTVHSHVLSDAQPSDDDAVWAAHLGVDTLAIFNTVTDELKVWRLNGDSFAEVEFAVAWPTSRADGEREGGRRFYRRPPQVRDSSQTRWDLTLSTT